MLMLDIEHLIIVVNGNGVFKMRIKPSQDTGPLIFALRPLPG